MKRILAILLVCVLCISFAACGKKSDDDTLKENPADTAAPSETDNSVIDFNDVVLIDDDNVTIELVNFYEKETNWSETDGGPQVEKFITFNVKNKTDGKINLWLQSFLDDETMSSSLSGGGSSVEAGRSATMVYDIRHDSAPYNKALDSLDELYKLEGQFDISSLESPQAFNSYDVVFSVDKILNGKSVPDVTEEPTTEAPTANMIDLTIEKGTIKYLGFEKAKPGLIIPYANQSDPTDKSIVLKFEFTNLLDTPQHASSAFIFQSFQNGVELNDSPAYSSKGGDQYSLVKNHSSEVLKGGTVTFGEIVVLSDDSPLTLIVTENGGSKSQTMEIDVKKPGDFKVDDTKTTPASNKDSTTKAPETTQPKPTVKKINDGDVIETDNFKFTLKKVELTYQVKPKDTSSYYDTYDADSGKVFVHLMGDYYNKSKRDICIRDLFTPSADFNNGYLYDGFTVVEDGNDFLWVSSYVVCSPLETCVYHGLVECPEVVKTQTDAPLFVTFKIDGTTYQYDIR